MTSLDSAIAEIRQRIAAAAERAGRDPSTITLIAVSKGQTVEKMRMAHALGLRDFAESYAQELRDKARLLADLPDLRFHFIGHLQRNKVRQVLPWIRVLQSVDRLQLVDELVKVATAPAHTSSPPAGRIFNPEDRLRVLLEINIGGEPAKHGARPAELASLLGAVERSPLLELRGLMCIPPEGQAPERYFRELLALREHHGGARRLPELSMGMSSDFEIAIACGATCVRIGTALFGPRSPRSPSPTERGRGLES